jgi:hypothetical protein
MFTNSPALQADLLVEETEMRIVKDGFTGLHISNGQKYFWRIFFTPLPFQVKSLALLNRNGHKSQNSPLQ